MSIDKDYSDNKCPICGYYVLMLSEKDFVKSKGEVYHASCLKIDTWKTMKEIERGLCLITAHTERMERDEQKRT